MASVRRPCAVALLACAAAFLVTVGAQPKDNPILSDPNVVPIYMSPGAQPTVVSCYNQSSPSQAPECMIPVRRCPAGCRDLCYVHCPSCKLVCSKNTTHIHVHVFFFFAFISQLKLLIDRVLGASLEPNSV